MDAQQLVARHGEHAEGVVIAQIFLVGERELGQVGQSFQVAGADTFFVERLTVMRHIVIGMLQRPAQALQLQCLDFVAAGGFDRLQLSRGGACDGHGFVS